jgi:hypothetical protein
MLNVGSTILSLTVSVLMAFSIGCEVSQVAKGLMHPISVHLSAVAASNTNVEAVR